MPLVTAALKKPQAEMVKKRVPGGNVIEDLEDETAKIYVLRQEPMTVRVTWKSKAPWEFPPGNPEKPAFKGYKLELPWTYFITRMTHAGLVTDTFLFVAPKKLKDVNEKIFMPPLPNIYPSGHICNGTIRIVATDPPEKKASDLFAAFWATPFTSETYPRDRYLIPEAFKELGAVSKQPWTFLTTWEVCSARGTKISWKTYRARIGRRYIRIETLKDAMQYALVFPDRNEIYS